MDIDEHFEDFYTRLTKGSNAALYQAMKKMLKERESDNLRVFYRDLFCIFSMASNCHSSAMWAHYSANHTGICIGYDSNHPFFKGDGTLLSPLHPVVYRTVPAVYSKDDPKRVLFTKAIEWAYEQESRMVIDFDKANWDPSQLKEVIRGVKIDERGRLSRCFVKVPFEAITEIVIGFRANVDFAGYVEQRGKELGKKILYAKPSNTSFQIDKVSQKIACIGSR